MKLKNKKTGEVVETGDNYLHLQGKYLYSSLAELNEEWEDYEEPKEYYAIDLQGDIIRWARHSWDEETTNKIKEIGNYFSSREEAEKAVEKLRAWKRLKDNGFEFKRWEIIDGRIDFMILPKGEYREKVYDDLDLLFGGEE